MLLIDILKGFLPSNEIKIRHKNGSILVNNTKVPLDTDVKVSEYHLELGEFIFHNVKYLNGYQYFFNIKDLFGEPVTINDQEIEKLKFIEGFTLITISKNQSFVFLNE